MQKSLAIQQTSGKGKKRKIQKEAFEKEDLGYVVLRRGHSVFPRASSVDFVITTYLTPVPSAAERTWTKRQKKSPLPIMVRRAVL